MAARTGPRAPTAAEAAEWQPATTVVGMHLYISLSLSLSLSPVVYVRACGTVGGLSQKNEGTSGVGRLLELRRAAGGRAVFRWRGNMRYGDTTFKAGLLRRLPWEGMKEGGSFPNDIYLTAVW
jgi:hypothetical protein